MEAALRLGRARARSRVPYEMSLAERLLIGRLKERDPSAFEEIVRRYGDKVFNLVYRMLGNRHEAEDITQEVFITVFKTVETFRGEAKFTTWLLRIAANQSKNRIKYLSRRPTDSAEIDEAGGPPPGVAATPGPVAHGQIDGPDILMEAAELESLMQKAIASLDEEHRLLVILRDVEELSYQEIGEITGLPEGTIKSRLHRARMAIKEVLDRHTR
ncbi:MAG: sigma-70 family RNA polymerase sigma factor [Pseudomonadota bacterium]